MKITNSIQSVVVLRRDDKVFWSFGANEIEIEQSRSSLK